MQINGAVVAGCSCALGLAKFMVRRALVRLQSYPSLVSVNNMVDGIALQLVGSYHRVAEVAAATLDKLLIDLKWLR